MDRLERTFDYEATMRSVLDARASRIWTALPCIVQSFNRALNTVQALPTINGRLKQPDGTYTWIEMPVLVDVPVQFPGGGGMTMVFDIAAGDEVLVILCARCIDNWWFQGYVPKQGGATFNPANNPPEFRMHNLSDGFAIPQTRNKTRALAVDPGVCRIRTDDDSAYLEFNPTAKTMSAVFSGGVTINGVTIDSSGNVATSGNVTSKGKVLATHVHSGVTTGSGNTGAPV